MKTLLSFCAILILAACASMKSSGSDYQGDIISITHGTSYGMCRGYCLKDEHYTPGKLVFTISSRDSVAFPAKIHKEDYSTADFEKLVASFNWSVWDTLPANIGCPDCTDRGAEYIEITTKKGTKRVRFDAHSHPAGLDAPLEILRIKRKDLEKKTAPKEE